MSKKPESRLQRKIRTRLASEFPRSWFIKIHGSPFQPSGTADLLGCVEGLFFALEVKMPGEEPSELQKDSLREIRRAGGIAECVETEEEAVAIVRKAIRLSTTRT